MEQRNQVAHSGKVDEKKSLNYIKENTIPFLLLFGKVISEILTNDILNLLIGKNMLARFPEVKRVFNNEIIWFILGDNSLAVGDKLVYTNGQDIGCCNVVSIRINDESVMMVDSLVTQEATVGVDKKVKSNWTFYKYADI